MPTLNYKIPANTLSDILENDVNNLFTRIQDLTKFKSNWAFDSLESLRAYLSADKVSYH